MLTSKVFHDLTGGNNEEETAIGKTFTIVTNVVSLHFIKYRINTSLIAIKYMYLIAVTNIDTLT